MRWNRVDLDVAKMEIVEALDEADRSVTAKPPKTKAGRRTISLPAIVVEALRAHKIQQLETSLLLGLGRPPDDAIVFPAGRWLRQSSSVHEPLVARGSASGVPEATWHSLRHSHASMLIAAKVPITTIAARLGHADAGVTWKSTATCSPRTTPKLLPR